MPYNVENILRLREKPTIFTNHKKYKWVLSNAA